MKGREQGENLGVEDNQQKTFKTVMDVSMRATVLNILTIKRMPLKPLEGEWD